MELFFRNAELGSGLLGALACRQWLGVDHYQYLSTVPDPESLVST